MGDDAEVEVYRALREAQNRYSYFLLAAGGAAIGLAVNQTQTAALSWSQVPLAVAVVLWGLSFYFGCRHLAYMGSSLYANFAIFQIEHGAYPGVGAHPSLIAAATAGVRDAIESNSKKALRYARWQSSFLIAGALAYLAWHVLEMYLRTHK